MTCAVHRFAQREHDWMCANAPVVTWHCRWHRQIWSERVPERTRALQTWQLWRYRRQVSVRAV